jgi:hypothetical protein
VHSEYGECGGDDGCGENKHLHAQIEVGLVDRGQIGAQVRHRTLPAAELPLVRLLACLLRSLRIAFSSCGSSDR